MSVDRGFKGLFMFLEVLGLAWLPDRYSALLNKFCIYNLVWFVLSLLRSWKLRPILLPVGIAVPIPVPRVTVGMLRRWPLRMLMPSLCRACWALEAADICLTWLLYTYSFENRTPLLSEVIPDNMSTMFKFWGFSGNWVWVAIYWLVCDLICLGEFLIELYWVLKFSMAMFLASTLADAI